MNKTALIGIFIIALIGATAYAALQGYIPGYAPVTPTTTPTESTTPPPTPSGNNTGTITGTVMVGSTCPGATRMPPDPQCAPHGYQTLVSVYVKIHTEMAPW